jgi:nucleoside-diphosphate-sugar epimerase
MVFLITGGTGFVGNNLVSELVNNKDEWGISKDQFKVLVRGKSNTDKLSEMEVQMVTGDLAKPSSLKKAVEDVSVILHLGAVVLDQSPPELLQKVNVEGTKALAEIFMKQKSAEKFVFVSTWGVYGYKVKPKPMTEKQPFDPTNEYHKSKVEAEKVLWDLNKENGLTVSVARQPMIMGPGDTLTTPRVIQAFFNGKVKLIGDAKNKFSGIHVRDAARAILQLGLKKEANNDVFNVKSFNISQREYWETHADAINYNEKIPRYPKWLAISYAFYREILAKIKGEGKPTLTRHRVMRYGNTRILDTNKIENKLNWEPKYTDGKKVIRNTVQWLEDNNFIDYEDEQVKILRRWEDGLKRKNSNQ